MSDIDPSFQSLEQEALERLFNIPRLAKFAINGALVDPKGEIPMSSLRLDDAQQSTLELSDDFVAFATRNL